MAHAESELTDTERESLEALARKRTAPQPLTLRRRAVDGGRRPDWWSAGVSPQMADAVHGARLRFGGPRVGCGHAGGVHSARMAGATSSMSLSRPTRTVTGTGDGTTSSGPSWPVLSNRSASIVARSLRISARSSSASVKS